MLLIRYFLQHELGFAALAALKCANLIIFHVLFGVRYM
jgi:hypothetical protein